MRAWLLDLTVLGHDRAITIGGWTPGIQALVRGRLLPCGCLTGLYKMSSGDVAEIIDAAGADCAAGHVTNSVLPPSRTGPEGRRGL
jgi:hypothetical protein